MAYVELLIDHILAPFAVEEGEEVADAIAARIADAYEMMVVVDEEHPKLLARKCVVSLIHALRALELHHNDGDLFAVENMIDALQQPYEW